MNCIKQVGDADARGSEAEDSDLLLLQRRAGDVDGGEQRRGRYGRRCPECRR